MYPCVLYCKVERISGKKEKDIPCELCQARICYRTAFLGQNCAKCVLEVRPSHTVCGKTSFSSPSRSLSLFFFFFICPSRAGAVLYLISSQICTYSEWENTVFDVVFLWFPILTLGSQFPFLVTFLFFHCSVLFLDIFSIFFWPRKSRRLSVIWCTYFCFATDEHVSTRMNQCKVVPRLAPLDSFMFLYLCFIFRGGNDR